MNEIKPPIKAVIFDFGGVLIDWNPHHLYLKYFHDDPIAVDVFLEEIGFREWNTQQDAGYPFDKAVAELSSSYPQYANLIRAYDDHWIESVGGPIQGTVDILEELKTLDIPLFGLSNWAKEKFDLVRPDLAFLDWFETIVLSGEVKLTKPDPRIFRLLLEKIGLPAQACLFIDDSQANVDAADQLGFQCIRFTNPDDLRSRLISDGLLRC